jgi:uncharacterized membrane protein YdbT with pleckstrin-like domain
VGMKDTKWIIASTMIFAVAMLLFSWIIYICAIKLVDKQEQDKFNNQQIIEMGEN